MIKFLWQKFKIGGKTLLYVNFTEKMIVHDMKVYGVSSCNGEIRIHLIQMGVNRMMTVK